MLFELDFDATTAAEGGGGVRCGGCNFSRAASAAAAAARLRWPEACVAKAPGSSSCVTLAGLSCAKRAKSIRQRCSRRLPPHRCAPAQRRAPPRSCARASSTETLATAAPPARAAARRSPSCNSPSSPAARPPRGASRGRGRRRARGSPTRRSRRGRSSPRRSGRSRGCSCSWRRRGRPRTRRRSSGGRRRSSLGGNIMKGMTRSNTKTIKDGSSPDKIRAGEPAGAQQEEESQSEQTVRGTVLPSKSINQQESQYQSQSQSQPHGCRS